MPGIKQLIDNPSWSAQLKKAVKRVSICAYKHCINNSDESHINHAINEARSSDAARLRDKIVSYATLNPSAASLSPPIPAGSFRSQMGLNHPVLTGYLSSVGSVNAFLKDPEGWVIFLYISHTDILTYYDMDIRTRKKLESRKIKISSTDFPAFLWEENGHKFDEANTFQGFFRGFYIEWVSHWSHSSVVIAKSVSGHKAYLYWPVARYGW